MHVASGFFLPSRQIYRVVNTAADESDAMAAVNMTHWNACDSTACAWQMQAVTKQRCAHQLTRTVHSASEVFGKAGALLVVTCYFSSVASGFHFYLHTGEQRYFGDAGVVNSKVLIEFAVSTGSV